MPSRADAGPAQLRLETPGSGPGAGTATPVYVHALIGAPTPINHLGSSAAATNAAGASLWTEYYYPFGEKWFNDPANANDTGFTGHIDDAATGLTYMQARYYDPVIGRFLSTDPIGYQDQLNLYAYVGNDPVNMVDPNGEFGVPGAFVGAIIGAVANSAAYALTAGEDFNALGLAANAVEGLVVGATIGSGAGIVTTLAVGAVQNVGTELISDAGASAKAGEARGIYASETAVDAVSNVLGDAAQGAAAAGVGKALAGPVGSRVSAAAAEVGEALTSAGSKAYGPALGATAPAIGQAAGNAPGATVDVIFDDAQDEINR